MNDILIKDAYKVLKFKNLYKVFKKNNFNLIASSDEIKFENNILKYDLDANNKINYFKKQLMNFLY